MRFRKKTGKIGHRVLTPDDLDTLIAVGETFPAGYIEIADKTLVAALKSCHLVVTVDGMNPEMVRGTTKLRDSLHGLIQCIGK